MATKRRLRLVPKGGVECFEVRYVRYIGPDGKIRTQAEITWPDGSDCPDAEEVMASHWAAGRQLEASYDED